MSKLAELRQARAKAFDELKALAEVETKDFDQSKYDAAKKAVEDLDAQITRLIETQELEAKGAQPKDVPAGTFAKADPQPKKPEVKGAVLSRTIACLAAAGGNIRDAKAYAEEKFGSEGSEPIVRALSVSLGASGGFLVPEAMASEVIELLRPESAVFKLQPRVIEMPNGNFTLPGVATGAQASYVGEEENITKTEQTFRQVKLVAKKLAAIVPMSNDMIRYPTTSVDSFVREDLTAALAERADLALIRGNGGEHSPRGLKSYADALSSPSGAIAANATVNLANVTVDLGKLRLALRGSNVKMRRPGFIMSPRSEQYLRDVRDGNGNFAFRDEMNKGTLDQIPYATSTQIPDNLGGSSNASEVYIADFAEFLVGDAMSLEIKVFDGGAYHDGTGLVSGVSQDQQVIRAIVQHDSGLRQDRAVAYLSGVTWGA